MNNIYTYKINELLIKNNWRLLGLAVLTAVTIFLAVKIGFDIAHNSYTFLAFLLIVAIVFIVFQSTKSAIVILLLLGFMGHQIIQFGAPPELIYCWDLIVLLLFIKTLFTISLSPRSLMLTGIVPIVGVIGILAIE